jgi:hypothetical protein
MYAQQAYVRFDEVLHDVLREAEYVVMNRPKQWRQGKKTAFVGLAAEFGLQYYVKRRLEESPDLLTYRGRLLLEHALLRDFTVSVEQLPKLPTDLQRLRPEIVQLLLDHGASTNRKYADETFWARFLSRLHRDEITAAEKPDLVKVLSSMVKHERIMNRDVVIGQEWRRDDRKAAGVLYSKEAEYDRVMSADSIIASTFNKAEVEEIIRHVIVIGPPKREWPRWMNWTNWLASESSEVSWDYQFPRRVQYGYTDAMYNSLKPGRTKRIFS